MEIKSSGWVKRVAALVVKDIKSELRTRYALNSLLMFALVTLVVVSFTLGPMGAEPRVHAVLLWIALFFSSMAGISRGIVQEVEKGTADALRLTVPAELVYVGKLIFNTCLLLIVNLLILLFYYFFMSPPGNGVGGVILVVMLGTISLSGASTLLSAMVARASLKGALLPVLAFPILLPALLSAVEVTQLAFKGKLILGWGGELQMLVFYPLVLITASYLLFPLVWED